MLGRRATLVWLIVASCCLGHVGCNQKTESKTVLEFGNGAEPKDLDPHIVTGVPEHHIISELLEGLVSVDPKTVEPVPAVAEAWEISEDGKTYTFALRKDAKWSNSDPVTASDFVYSWRRLVDPKTGSLYADMAYPVKCAESINKGELNDLTKLGVEALDDYTLKVTLRSPTPYFLGTLYHYTMYPVHRKTIEAHGARWTKPEHYVGNGPFILKKWVLNHVVEVEKSPTYWDRDRVRLKQVNFHAIEDISTEEKVFRAGRLHVTKEVPLARIPFWQKDESGVYNQHPYFGAYFYRLNTTREPLNDERVRRALALALDRDQIVKYVTRGGQIPATALTPPRAGGYEPRMYLPTNLDRLAEARALLAEAGYPNGDGMRRLQLLYNTSESHKKIAEAIQQMWKKNLGVDIELFNQEWKVYLARQRTMDYDVARAAWIGDYKDPNTFLDMWVTDRGNNATGWSSEEYDSLLKQASLEADFEKRTAFFGRAETLLMEAMPIIPIYIYTRVYLKRVNVKGWHPNVMDFHPLKHVWLK